MKKDLKCIVKIFDVEMTKEEKLKRQAEFFIQLNKMKYSEKYIQKK